MVLKLLALLNSDDYHPFYKLSTKGNNREIIVDGMIERRYSYDHEDTFNMSPIGQIPLRSKEKITVTDEIAVMDSNEHSINKDWLIRAKRDKLKELQYKFYRRDEE